jgi:hypothetical protein
MKIELGTEITGCFGAMHPEKLGKVVTIDATATPECKVVWNDFPHNHTWVLLSEIRDDYFDPKVPAIGYFAVDTDRAWDWVTAEGTPAEESRLWKR